MEAVAADATSAAIRIFSTLWLSSLFHSEAVQAVMLARGALASDWLFTFTDRSHR